MENPSSKRAAAKAISAYSRNALLQNLVSIGSVLGAEAIEDFSRRLSSALLLLSEQSVRPAEAELAFNAFNHLRKQSADFHETFVQRLGELLAKEVHILEQARAQDDAGPDTGADLSLVTFEEMENKVLLGNVSQALEQANGEALNALTLRIAWLLGREDMDVAENPFRPQVFVQAVYQAWCRIDPSVESHRVVLHALGPDLFLPLPAILQALNETLVERSVLPNLTEAYKLKKSENTVGLPPPKVDKQHRSRYNKVRDWLLSAGKKGKAEAGADDLNVPELFANDAGGGWAANTISHKVGPRLFGYLNNIQSQVDRIAQAERAASVSFRDEQGAATLRKVREQAPAGLLTAVDENTIELLAKIFDFILQEHSIPPEIRKLLGMLQIPMLKAALLDKKFFIKEDHPARKLVDTLAKSGVAWNPSKGYEDPLYKMIENIVEKVNAEYDQQMGYFAEAVSGLESFLTAEEKRVQDILSAPIAEALRQERIARAKEAAESDIASRLDTGEVASVVENFLETQWVRILTLAHSTREKKPEVLMKSLKAMDDLIWSVKPKNSPEQRKELISRLPSILAMLNAWLDAIKWHEPERVTFFSNLAERHAAIVRMQPELSPRHHVTVAVNIAEKASARRMKRSLQETGGKSNDQFRQAVNALIPGGWVEFQRPDGSHMSRRLAWVSPGRSRFIFTDGDGREPIPFTDDELTEALRTEKAALLEMESIVDRALNVALDGDA